jgi:hypothetical protein
MDAWLRMDPLSRLVKKRSFARGKSWNEAIQLQLPSWEFGRREKIDVDFFCVCPLSAASRKSRLS